MYFSDAHEELRLHVRKFLEKEVQPHLEEWEEKTFPDSIFKRFGELGFLGLRYPVKMLPVLLFKSAGSCSGCLSSRCPRS